MVAWFKENSHLKFEIWVKFSIIKWLYYVDAPSNSAAQFWTEINLQGKDEGDTVAQFLIASGR